MGHGLFMEDDWRDGCWRLWLLIETAYSQEEKRGVEMLTLDRERLLRRTEVSAAVDRVRQYLPGTAATPITSRLSPPTSPTCLLVVHSCFCPQQADLFSVFIACLSFKFPTSNVTWEEALVCPFLLRPPLSTAL